jgi:hypothetical protein
LASTQSIEIPDAGIGPTGPVVAEGPVLPSTPAVPELSATVGSVEPVLAPDVLTPGSSIAGSEHATAPRAIHPHHAARFMDRR